MALRAEKSQLLDYNSMPSKAFTMKALNFFFSVAILITTTTTAIADYSANQDWLKGKWVAQGKLGYAPALNEYVLNYFEVTEEKFSWTRVVGRHNELTHFEYELDEQGNLYLYSEKFNTEARLTNKGSFLSLCLEEYWEGEFV